MRTHYLAAIVAAAVLAPGASLAQTPAEDGARAGGAVGGIIGGTVGAAVQLPGEIVGAVTRAPGRSVVVEERVVIGEPLPPAVALVPVPQYREYSYAIVNDRRVIVEPRTRRVIHIIE
jgi:uncharacterized protein DUF1236